MKTIFFKTEYMYILRKNLILKMMTIRKKLMFL